MTDITVITNSSWEERHPLGIERIIRKISPSKILSFYLESFSAMTFKNRQHVANNCKKGGIEYEEISLINRAQYWKKIQSSLNDECQKTDQIYIDISTMPREIIWIIFSFLGNKINAINYVYNEPLEYNDDWLCRNHSKPRLVFKLSGIYDLTKPTSLISLSGYDIERVKHIIQFFEPQFIKIGIQIGNQFQNKQRNYDLHKNMSMNSLDIETFEMDAYGNDHGGRVIEEKIQELVTKSNIIICSLGPKLSAISLFRLHQKYPQIALSYIPSKEYNPSYSIGIKGFHEGVV